LAPYLNKAVYVRKRVEWMIAECSFHSWRCNFEC